MEKSLFFSSNDGDRIVRSSDLAIFFSKLFTNGVFNNSCKVKSNDNMSITVSKGYAFINGYFYYNDSDLVIPISIADSNQSRIDTIVLRYSSSNRNITAQVIEGNYATNPVSPDISRTNNEYDLRLANIYVNSGIGEITQNLIEDTRFLSECGNVTQAVLSLDTSEIFSQYGACFNSWFENLQINLDSNVAGNLQNQIGNTQDLSTIAGNLVGAINEIKNNVTNITENSNYIIIGNTLFMWGSFNKAFLLNEFTGNTITFPETLANNNYSVIVGPETDFAYFTEISYSAHNKTTTSCQVGGYNGGNGPISGNCSYMIIGTIANS